MTPRKLALDLLQRLEKNSQFSNIALDRALQREEMSDADKGLVSALFYGVTERRITLDYNISLLSARPLGEIDGETLTALRLGIYQLAYMDRIPPHAAINETVSLCKKRSTGFVNAVLRAFTRGNGLRYPSENGDYALYLSVKYSVGLPLANRMIADFGKEAAREILSGFDKIPETTISVNTLKISRDSLAERLNGATPTAIAPTGLRVKGSVRELYGFDDGLFFVQDEASQICVAALGAAPGDRVLDICACPGSKTFGAAISMRNEGKITAFDLHAKKLPLITAGADRLGITLIDTEERDGRDYLPELDSSADKIICDVPCSGFGVLWKKPELRYKDPAESSALPSIQLDILKNASRYLKRGGILVYSTCTIFPEENEENIKRFLSENKDFSLTPFSVGELDFSDGYGTLYPHKNGTDGFFIARLRKNT